MAQYIVRYQITLDANDVRHAIDQVTDMMHEHCQGRQGAFFAVKKKLHGKWVGVEIASNGDFQYSENLVVQ